MNHPLASVQIPGSEVQQSKRGTGFSGRWLVLVRFVWAALSVLVLAYFLASIPVYFAQLQTVCVHAVCPDWQLTQTNTRALQNAGLSVNLYAVFSLALSLFSVLVWIAVAAFIVWRKSNDWLVLLASLLLVTQGVVQFGGSLSAPLEYSSRAWYLPTVFLLLLDTTLYLLVFSLFPNGRFVPAWMRWLVTAEIALGVILFLLPTSSWNTATLFTSPTVSQFLLIWVIIIGWVSIIAGQIYRYQRVSNPTERQQTKWVVLGIIEGPVVFVLYYFPPLLFPELRAPDSLYFLLFKPVYTIVFLFAPLCFGIAILRYRLWDIDVLINRTLVYGTLTVMLALVYFGLILSLQSLVRLFTGQLGQSPIVIVASTLTIAALFQPLRQRIQTIIDRRFYRRKYDAQKTLAAFNASLRHEVNLTEMSEHLLAVIQETMQPDHLSLWLRPSALAGKQSADWNSTPFALEDDKKA